MIDDLDRCNPDRIIETLEAIKLFLAVEKTTFIISMDENVITYSIKKKYPQLDDVDIDISTDYIEKMVQLPVRIAELAETDIKNYMLLLVSEMYLEENSLNILIEKLKEKEIFIKGEIISARDLMEIIDSIQGGTNDNFKQGYSRTVFEEEIQIFNSIGGVIATTLKGNPRQTKRFLNTFYLRKRLAEIQRIPLNLAILAKLMVLEYIEQKKNTCLVGFREYNLLTSRQNELFNAIDKAYPIINKELILFNVNPFAPIQLGKERIALSAESTSRSRSLLFLAGAVAIASILGKNTPVYIPENGFIGINVPLTDSRNGSCSTRTTHPIFIKSINKILHQVGLCHEISNFYWDKSKGEILAEHIEKPVFNKYAHRTLSCSHPCLSRYDKKKDPTIEVPCNCGYCYPCIIRRAFFIVNGKDDTRYNDLYKLDKEFLMNYSSLQGRSSDLRAVLFSIRRFYQNKNDEGYIRDLLVRQGGLSSTEIIAYGRVYRKSMEELISLIRYLDLNNKGKLISYLGIEGLVGNA
ncbi:hypothetical protein UACE39S_05695 [Ureibacillus acetophenoni]